jgi:AcrR family transcriptional regulator
MIMAALPETRVRNMDARRRRILAEAQHLLAGGGTEALTIRALADRACVTVPTIYNLVGAKEQVVAALITEALDRMDAAVAALPAARGISRAEAAVRANLDMCAAEPERYAALYRTLEDVQGSAAPLGPLFRRAGETFCTAVREAQKDGDLHGRLRPVPLGHHILHAQVETFRLWGVGALDVAATEARALYTLYVTLMADATKQGRRVLLERLHIHEARLDT